MTSYDAVLFIGFGGPEKKDDIMPFLEIVTRGRGIPKERLMGVAHHYELMGGKSPINEITRHQAAGMEAALQAIGVNLPVFIGQRNWHPFLADTLRDMGAKGIKRVIGFPAAAHRCEASLERYIAATEAARQEAGPTAPLVDYVDPWFDHPLFIEAIAQRVQDALKSVPADHQAQMKWFFTAHSIPCSMAKGSTYVQELRRTAQGVCQTLGRQDWALAYSSRSGNPREPWLEPDVSALIRDEAARGTKTIFFIPTGFIADHVEILFDLDIEAKEAAQECGITLYRSRSVGDHPTFTRMMAEVVKARMNQPEAPEQQRSTTTRYADGSTESMAGASSTLCYCHPDAQDPPCVRWRSSRHRAVPQDTPAVRNMSRPLRVIVVGGGISGLAAAWRLQQAFQTTGAALDLSLIEASPRVGGSLQSERRDGFLLEMGPDCFISEKPRGVGLCKELGLESELIGTRSDFRQSFILRNNRFHPVPEGFYLMGPSRPRPFLESKLLSWPGKLRAMLEPLIPSRPVSDESLASFVRRRFGQELLDWMAQPLIGGIYGARPEDLSLRSTFPQFLDMENKYGSVLLGLRKRQTSTKAASGARYSLFMSLKGGTQQLSDALSAKLGSAIQTGKRATALSRHAGGEGWSVQLSGGETLQADAVCLTLPSYAIADLLRPLDDGLSRDLAGIAYAPAATANFAFREQDLKRPLPGIGFVVPHKENRLTLGCTFAHHKFEGRAPKGSVLIRAFLGGVQQTAWTEQSEEAVTSRVYEELKGWLGIDAPPLFSRLQRYARALPQYNVGHLPRLLRIEEAVLRYPGLSMAGNWQYGVGIPDCIQAGERAADQLISFLGRQAPVTG